MHQLASLEFFALAVTLPLGLTEFLHLHLQMPQLVWMELFSHRLAWRVCFAARTLQLVSLE
jgi:hypothetical protein